MGTSILAVGIKVTGKRGVADAGDRAEWMGFYGMLAVLCKDVDCYHHLGGGRL